jgi:hypothetical protein
MGVALLMERARPAKESSGDSLILEVPVVPIPFLFTLMSKLRLYTQPLAMHQRDKTCHLLHLFAAGETILRVEI